VEEGEREGGGDGETVLGRGDVRPPSGAEVMADGGGGGLMRHGVEGRRGCWISSVSDSVDSETALELKGDASSFASARVGDGEDECADVFSSLGSAVWMSDRGGDGDT